MKNLKQPFLMGILLCLFISTSISASNVPQYKVDTVNKIFNDLKAAKGILPHEPPKIILDEVFPGNGELTIAFISYKFQEIHLEERVYDICTSKLKADSLNGIAFILGHELAHYIHEHENVAHHSPPQTTEVLGDSVLMKIIKENLPNLDTIRKQDIAFAIHKYQEREGEAQADLEGGFIAYLAGYQSDRELPTLPALFLQEVYDSIGMDTLIEGYPSLSERQTIASSSKIVLDSLVFMYEMANNLITLEHYAAGINYLDKLTKSFESRELFNNMGVACLLDATKCFDSDDLPDRLPITLDLESRMDGSGKGRADYTEEIRNEKIIKAIRYLEQSADMDEEYPIARLNLSIGRFLLAKSYKLSESIFSDSILKLEAYEEQLKLAESELIKAKLAILRNLASEQKETKKDQLMSDVYLQYSVLSSVIGNDAMRDIQLEKSKKWSVNNEDDIQVLGMMNSVCKDPESVTTNFDILAISSELESQWSSPTNVINLKRKRNNLSQNFEKFENEKIKAYRHKVKLSSFDKSEIVVVVPKQMEKTNCNIQKGSTKEEVTTQYGDPIKILSVSNGTYYTYKNQLGNAKVWHGIVFHLDNENKVKDWFIYVEADLL